MALESCLCFDFHLPASPSLTESSMAGTTSSRFQLDYQVGSALSYRIMPLPCEVDQSFKSGIDEEFSSEEIGFN